MTSKLGLCQTRSENLKTAFLTVWIICASILIIAQFRVSEPKKMYQISAGNDIAVRLCVCACVRACVCVCVGVCVCVCVGKISEFS